MSDTILDFNATADDLVKHYFELGYSYKEISASLSTVHNVQLSIRQINRILRRFGLYRRHNHASPESILLGVADEIKGSGSSIGYRSMHQRLRAKGLTVDRESVQIAIKELDPNGVLQRSIHRFNRRRYISKGPNHIWHVDGYDKLKPFGLAIHGCIDGYSRKIIWLEVGSSNNNPKIIGSFFLDAIKKHKLVPRCVRADRGSENVAIGGLQRFFRRFHDDGLANDLSFRYGPSTRNQRIESWWSILRKSCTSWWINFFKDLCDETVFDPSIWYHVQFLRFCFMSIVQTELDQTKNLWNNHYIRKTRNAESPPGRPNVLYFTPLLSGGEDCKLPLNNLDLLVAEQMVEEPIFLGCCPEILEFSTLVMQEYDIDIPKDFMQAKDLLLLLLREINQI